MFNLGIKVNAKAGRPHVLFYFLERGGELVFWGDERTENIGGISETVSVQHGTANSTSAFTTLPSSDQRQSPRLCWGTDILVTCPTSLRLPPTSTPSPILFLFSLRCYAQEVRNRSRSLLQILNGPPKCRPFAILRSRR